MRLRQLAAGLLAASALACASLPEGMEGLPDDTRFALELRLSGLGRRGRVPGHPERSRSVFRNANF